jgi:hypothetical protein
MADEEQHSEFEGEPAAVLLSDHGNNVTDSTVGYMYTKLSESMLC